VTLRPNLDYSVADVHQVRCSGGDNSGDPDNVCKDQQPNDGQCGTSGTSPANGVDNRLEAYSDPAAKYSRITFCNKFFNDLTDLSTAVTNGKRRSATDQNNLETWNSRARCFLHEATHLDYFMNAPEKSPFTNDLTFQYKAGGITQNAEGYGPYFAKMIRNYSKAGKGGFYTQRNGKARS